MELRVADVPRDRVRPQQVGLPVRGGGRPHPDRGHGHGEHDDEPTQAAFDAVAERPAERVVLRVERQRLAHPQESEHGQAADEAADDREDAEEQHLRLDHGRVHGAVLHRVEPQVGGRDVHEDEEQLPQHSDGGDCDQCAKAPLARGAQPGVGYRQGGRWVRPVTAAGADRRSTWPCRPGRSPAGRRPCEPPGAVAALRPAGFALELSFGFDAALSVAGFSGPSDGTRTSEVLSGPWAGRALMPAIAGRVPSECHRAVGTHSAHSAITAPGPQPGCCLDGGGCWVRTNVG